MSTLVLLPVGLEAHRREGHEAAALAGGVEPLEEAPCEAAGEEFPQRLDLPPAAISSDSDICIREDTQPQLESDRVPLCIRDSAYLASLAPWGVWKLLMRWAVAVPLG